MESIDYLWGMNNANNNKMTHFQTKPHIFRSEVIGWIHIFDCDIEIQTDLSNEIVDYSGCGFKKATQLIQSINKIKSK